MDNRELVAAIVGAALRWYLLTDADGKGAVDNAVIGAAGGALGGMVAVYYAPGWGMLAAAASGVAGMLAFDYFLFEV